MASDVIGDFISRMTDRLDRSYKTFGRFALSVKSDKACPTLEVQGRNRCFRADLAVVGDLANIDMASAIQNGDLWIAGVRSDGGKEMQENPTANPVVWAMVWPTIAFRCSDPYPEGGKLVVVL